MDKNNYIREIEDLVESIKNGRKLGYKINLLIGAGCSVSAGIPSAESLVRTISKEYKNEYKRCKSKNYGECMAKLTPVERRSLIVEAVKNAKINWAHLGIAQLLKHGYIDRVLTTNFDNLIVRACSVVQEFPAIYDLTSCNTFRSDLMFDGSVIYLHGQYNGFILCNTEKEVKKQKDEIKEIFKELNRKSIWIIVGYSGENDAISELLAEEEVNENRLYWIAYKHNKPTEFVMNKILGEEKFSFLIEGFDADSFFYNLINRLNCFPPQIIEKPFSYLDNILSSIKEYNIDNAISEVKINAHAKNIVSRAIEELEENPVFMCEHYLNIGMRKNAINLISENPKDKEDILKKLADYFGSLRNDYEKYINKYDKKANYENSVILENLITCYKGLSVVILSNEDEIIECLKKAERLSEILNNITQDIPNIITWVELLGELATRIDDKAEVYLKRAESIILENLSENNNYDLRIILINLYCHFNEVFINKGDIFTANQYFNSAKALLAKEYLNDKNDPNILIKWNELILKNIDLSSDKSVVDINEVNERFKLAYEINNNNAIYVSKWIKLSELLKKEIKSDKLVVSIFDSLKSIFYEYPLFLNDKFRRISIEFKKFSSIQTSKVANNFYDFLGERTIKYINSNKENDFETINEMAYEYIELGKYRIAKEMLDFCEKNNPKVNMYLATYGFWYFKNEEIDIEQAELRGIEYYNRFITELDEETYGIELKEVANEKKLLELAKLCYYRKKDITEANEVLKNITGENSREMGYINIYEEILEFKQILSEREVAIDNN